MACRAGGRVGGAHEGRRGASVKRHDARQKLLVDVVVFSILIGGVIALWLWKGRDLLTRWMK